MVLAMKSFALLYKIILKHTVTQGKDSTHCGQPVGDLLCGKHELLLGLPLTITWGPATAALCFSYVVPNL